jgi:hypothetical protein
MKITISGWSTKQEPDAHQEEREARSSRANQASSLRVPCSEDSHERRLRSPARWYPRLAKQIALLHHKHPAFVLRSAAHLPPGKVEMQSAHYVDSTPASSSETRNGAPIRGLKSSSLYSPCTGPNDSRDP